MEAACARALDAEVVSVPLIGRMVERATEAKATQPAASAEARPARFARDAGHFATSRSRPPQEAVSPPLFGADGGAA